jgi:hypothetical protein
MLRFFPSLRFVPSAAIVLLICATGCRSPQVETTVINSGATALHNIEVDYPSASFGISSLAPGQQFHYQLQLQDTGRMKVQFFDSAQKQHSGTGPYAVQGQQGTLRITIDGSGKSLWAANLHPSAPAPKGE